MQPLRGRRLISVLAALVGALTGGVLFRLVALAAPLWLAAVLGLFFVVAVVLMASTPWVLLQPDQEVRTELDRWFLTVAGSVDAITAGVLLALARRLRRTLLVLELAGCSHCGRRDHPSLPANIRCHPCNRRGATDRLSVLA